MKTIGIVADNYKLDKFKKELSSKGFTDIIIVPFTEDTSTIQVRIEEDKIRTIHAICIKVESSFKRQN
jgi:hypothetical protein